MGRTWSKGNISHIQGSLSKSFVKKPRKAHAKWGLSFVIHSSKMKEEKAAVSVTRGGSASARLGVGALLGGQTHVDAFCIISNAHIWLDKI